MEIEQYEDIERSHKKDKPFALVSKECQNSKNMSLKSVYIEPQAVSDEFKSEAMKEKGKINESEPKSQYESDEMDEYLAFLSKRFS